MTTLPHRPENTRQYRRARAALLRALSAHGAVRWSAQAAAEVICGDAGGPYNGGNPYRLLTTVAIALRRMAEAGLATRRDEVSASGRRRFVYRLTEKGRRAAALAAKEREG